MRIHICINFTFTFESMEPQYQQIVCLKIHVKASSEYLSKTCHHINYSLISHNIMWGIWRPCQHLELSFLAEKGHWM